MQYDNLHVTSSQRGVVADTSFDTITTGTSLGQWSFRSTAQLVTSTSASQNIDADRTTTNEYDAAGRVVWTSDALGDATRTVYDGGGRPIYVIAADGAVTRNDYDTDGRVVRTTTFANVLSKSTLASLSHAATASEVAALIVCQAGLRRAAGIPIRRPRQSALHDGWNRLGRREALRRQRQRARFDCLRPRRSILRPGVQRRRQRLLLTPHMTAMSRPVTTRSAMSSRRPTAPAQWQLTRTTNPAS